MDRRLDIVTVRLAIDRRRAKRMNLVTFVDDLPFADPKAPARKTVVIANTTGAGKN